MSLRLVEEICQPQITDNTTLIVEIEEELKSLLMRIKEGSENAGFKHNIKKTKLMASTPITSWQVSIRGKSGSRDRFYFLGL